MKRKLNKLFFLVMCLLLKNVNGQDTGVVNNLYRKLHKHESDKIAGNLKGVLMADTAKISMLYNLGRAYWLSNPDQSIKIARQMEEISKQLNYKKGIGLSYHLGGITYWFQGNYPNALNEFQKGLKIEEEIGNKSLISAHYMNMGGVYSDIGNNTEALKCQLKSLKIDLERGNKKRISNSRIHLGVLYKKLGKYDEALEQLYEALKICKEQNLQMEMGQAFSNIASVYEKQGKYKEAEVNNLNAIKILESIGDESQVCHSYSELGRIYFELKKFKEAIHFELKALEIAKSIGALQMESRSYQNLSKFYAAQGNFSSAYNYSMQYKQSEDSLFNTERNNKVTELKMQYEFDKKDAVLKAEQEKKDKINEATMLAHKNERILYVVLGIFLLLTVFTLWSRLNLARKTKRLVEEKNEQIRAEKEIAEQQRVRAELMDMRHKIAKDLHDDIGSSLSSIAIYSEVAQKITFEKVPEASKILTNVGEIAQEAMENMSDIVWTINPVNDKLDDIMQRLKLLAEHLKEASNITIHFDVPDDIREVRLNMHQRKNVYLIFKEAINNIAKYSGASNCFVLIKKQDEQILIMIKDDGRGFENKIGSMGGNGLINMQQRAQEMGGELEVFSEKGKGTELNFNFKT